MESILWITFTKYLQLQPEYLEMPLNTPITWDEHNCIVSQATEVGGPYIMKGTPYTPSCQSMFCSVYNNISHLRFASDFLFKSPMACIYQLAEGHVLVAFF